MTVSVKAETKILIGLIAVFAILGGVSLWRDQPPVITAICVSLMATACLYRFLGGVEGSKFTVAAVKATGSGAAFAAILWFVNGELDKQNPPIEPATSEWFAMDRTTGVPVEVTIGQFRVSPDTESLSDVEWRVERRDEAIRVVSGDAILARLAPESLDSIGLFNYAGMSEGRVIKFTDPLEQGQEADLDPPYPFLIKATDFSDDYNRYSILDRETRAEAANGLLRTETFDVFSYEDRTYVIFVSEAVHNDPNREPWAEFGFAELELRIR